MKNRKLLRKRKNKMGRDELKEMVNDENRIEEMEEYMKNINSQDEFNLLMDVIRESRIESLIMDLNIDYERYLETKKKIIKLEPNSKKYHLTSSIYQKHKGNYKVETLLIQYHDSIITEGIRIGADYGKKFMIEDMQNKRFSKEDILNMTKQEIWKYCNEEREEI